MAILPILTYPDPRLSTVAAPITVFDDKLRELAADMAQTMYAAPGIGLAATQVNIHKQLIVIDISEEKNQLLTLINPQVLHLSTETKTYNEGCLSVPDVYDVIERPDSITVRAQNLSGEFFEITADGLLSVCIQHEIDHLKGIVFVNYLSRLKQDRIQTKMRKRSRKLSKLELN